MKTNLFAVFLLLPVALSLGCAATYKDQINQQLWLRELRLMEDCNYRLKWQIEDMQHELDEANARIQTLTRETGTLRDRGSSTGPDLTLPPALRSPGGGGSGRDSEAPLLPPAPGSMDVQPGREFKPGKSSPPLILQVASLQRIVSATATFQRSVSPAQRPRSRAPRTGSIPTSTSTGLF